MGVVQQPVDCCRGDRPRHQAVKPEGWTFEVMATLRRS